MDIYQVQNLTFGYEPYEQDTGERTGEVVEILHDLSFSVEEGSFVLLCGATGCGKSTLLRLLKKELQPAGSLSGEILFGGKCFAKWSDRESAMGIGFVMQNPNDQCVTDKVWHELAFGLENMGIASSEIRRRVAEISAYFGIDEWYDRNVNALSGGQKQILNLAAVMVMNPRVLILDEPTAQLDPIAAQNFLQVLGKVNRELGITVILAEHRLEEAFSMADRVLVMEKGRIVVDDEPRKAAARIQSDRAIYKALPEAVRLYHKLQMTKDAQKHHTLQESVVDITWEKKCPLTIGEGRTFLREYLAEQTGHDVINANTETQNTEKRNSERRNPQKSGSAQKKAVLELKDIWFRYEKQSSDVLRGTSLQVYEGEILCLLGSNASGKTTVLKVIAGIYRPQEGKILIDGRKQNEEAVRRIGYLPQDVETLFVADTVERELALVGEKPGAELRPKCHPYDLSGGEKQLLGMQKVLAGGKTILLLDEPTKGLDAQAKETFKERLIQEKEKGVTIILVTHDPEFAAACADRCGLFFRGEVVSLEETRDFFQENRFYTTPAARIAKGYAKQVVTSEDLYTFCLCGNETG